MGSQRINFTRHHFPRGAPSHGCDISLLPTILRSEKKMAFFAVFAFFVKMSSLSKKCRVCQSSENRDFREDSPVYGNEGKGGCYHSPIRWGTAITLYACHSLDERVASISSRPHLSSQRCEHAVRRGTGGMGATGTVPFSVAEGGYGGGAASACSSGLF